MPEEAHDTHGDEIRRFVTTGVVLAVATVALQSALYLVHVYALDRGTQMFDLEEGGLVTWLSSSATFAAGLVAFLLSYVDGSQRIRGPALALAIGFLSFDDANFLHERISFRIQEAIDVSDTYLLVIWPMLYFPLLVAVAVLLLQVARETHVAQRLVSIGLLMLVAAVGMEVAGVALDKAGVDPHSWLWTLETICEEGLELAGWILIATGISARLLTLTASPSRTRASP
jgi:hypothetical protein